LLFNSTKSKNKIKLETGLVVSIKKGHGSMIGYTIFTTKKSENFDYNYSRSIIKQFPVCELNPSFANNYSISIYHGIES